MGYERNAEAIVKARQSPHSALKSYSCLHTHREAFEAVLDALEANGIKPKLGESARGLSETLKSYIAHCLIG